MFEPLRRVAAALRTTHWPSVNDLQRLAAARDEVIRSGGGAPLTFVPQAAVRPRRADERYEARIYLRGEVQVRQANWHDLLNAMVWLTFPHAKAALNARHYQALPADPGSAARNRGPVQDALTLFDEGGVIVAASDPGLLREVERFAWKDLFWHGRARVASGMRFHLFGHALYEKALAPFSGITGRGMLFEVAGDWLAAPIEAQIERLDRMVAERLRDTARVQSTREFAPVPILGIPGWCEENARASYYDDATYFRPGRSH